MTESDRNLNEKPGQHPLLRDILAEATFKPGRAILSTMDSVDLGVFSDEARKLANLCFQDSDNSDTGTLVYVTGKKKVLLPNYYFKAIKGEPLGIVSVTSRVQREIAEKNGLDERYLAMVIHTCRNTDLPFLVTDLFAIMLPDSDTGAAASVFSAGRTRNSLIFRGQDTPQLSIEEAEKKAKLWEWQLDTRIEEFIKSGMSEEERMSIIDKAERALLRQICQKYDLQFFSGDTHDAFVTKQTP